MTGDGDSHCCRQTSVDLTRERSGSILLGFLCTFCPTVFAPACWGARGDGNRSYPELTLILLLAGMGKKDDPKLMQEWFKLVQEKNALVRYESELMIL